MTSEIPYFQHFVLVRQLDDADCVISIEYYSELLNHVRKNREVLAQRNQYIISIFSPCQDFPIV